jgi:hypothetical protein
VSLRRRVEQMERRLPAPPPEPPPDRARQKRLEAVLRRWEGLSEQAASLLSADERQRVEQAAGELVEDFGGPFAVWLRDLRDGCCRLPPLTPEAMKALLLAWLSPEADGGMVCRRCGLEYPRHRNPPLSQWKLLPGRKPMEGPPPWYDLPEFFPDCPGCGASRFDIDWPHQTDGHDRPWKGLDGFVGLPVYGVS